MHSNVQLKLMARTYTLNVGIKDGRIEVVTGTDISAALAETLIRAVQDEC